MTASSKKKNKVPKNGKITRAGFERNNAVCITCGLVHYFLNLNSIGKLQSTLKFERRKNYKSPHAFQIMPSVRTPETDATTSSKTIYLI